MLEVKNICKSFRPVDGEEKVIFEDLSFTIEKGDFVTIVGENGTGKSTLMNLIAGSVFPDSGKIILDGEDITFMPEFKKSRFIGRVFQDPLKGTSPNLTVEENLLLASLRNSKRNLLWFRRKPDVKFFKEELSKLNMGLENRLGDKIGSLSGGQRQALTLLMATIVTPKILLLDEHTAALDPVSCERVLELTKLIAQKPGMITLMISHNLSFIEKLRTKVLKIQGGKASISSPFGENKEL